MSEPLRTCPVRTLPISRGRNRARSRISRRASSRMSRRCSSRFGALVHPGHRLDLVADLACCWAGRRADGDTRRPSCLAALRLAVKYSVSVRLVHHLGGQEGDLPPDAFVSHVRGAPIWAHRSGAGRCDAGRSRPSRDENCAKIDRKNPIPIGYLRQGAGGPPASSVVSIARILSRNRRFDPE